MAAFFIYFLLDVQNKVVTWGKLLSLCPDKIIDAEENAGKTFIDFNVIYA